MATSTITNAPLPGLHFPDFGKKPTTYHRDIEVNCTDQLPDIQRKLNLTTKLIANHYSLALASGTLTTEGPFTVARTHAWETMDAFEQESYMLFEARGVFLPVLDPIKSCDYADPKRTNNKWSYVKCTPALNALYGRTDLVPGNTLYFQRLYPGLVPLLEAVQKVLSAIKALSGGTGADHRVHAEYHAVKRLHAQAARRLTDLGMKGVKKTEKEEVMRRDVVVGMEYLLARRHAVAAGMVSERIRTAMAAKKAAAGAPTQKTTTMTVDVSKPTRGKVQKTGVFDSAISKLPTLPPLPTRRLSSVTLPVSVHITRADLMPNHHIREELSSPARASPRIQSKERTSPRIQIREPSHPIYTPNPRRPRDESSPSPAARKRAKVNNPVMTCRSESAFFPTVQLEDEEDLEYLMNFELMN
ncbi:uncharacterized protein EV422DRAFT_563329 [Fimicolochytrium jonesii]|uniref:uncharacterized protein n=1 Tax=Fimicolochytrium jonesii TaxID=1396493 RepID=UPI0022FE6330|nr:uncharacterized protein EV422DRAFT_563329 [Fimicolochytrium jonesii]KAI8827244.1 hypothetical protein EV422DRAFT_563329 [Fimicolochytrium jonesii]